MALPAPLPHSAALAAACYLVCQRIAFFWRANKLTPEATPQEYYQQHGYRGLYRGFVPRATRNCGVTGPSPPAQFLGAHHARYASSLSSPPHTGVAWGILRASLAPLPPPAPQQQQQTDKRIQLSSSDMPAGFFLGVGAAGDGNPAEVGERQGISLLQLTKWKGHYWPAGACPPPARLAPR